MAKYVVIYEDETKEDLTLDLIKEHVAHVRNLHSMGILFLCGPLKNRDGNKAMLILNANSQHEVESYVVKDPFIMKKWYANYHIYEWIEGNVDNNFLLDDRV